MDFLQPTFRGPALVEPSKGIRVAQTIWFGLILGLLTFFMVTLTVPAKSNGQMLSIIGVGAAMFQIAMRFVIPGFIKRAQIQKLTITESANLDAQLFAIFQTQLIVGLALLEGAGFFNLVCYMAEHQWWTLAILALLVLLMGMMFPTLGQFESWAENEKRELQNRF